MQRAKNRAGGIWNKKRMSGHALYPNGYRNNAVVPGQPTRHRCKELSAGGSNANSAFVTSAPATNHQVTLSHEIQPGTWIECVCDGTNWILSGCANVSAVGKVVFGS